MEHWGFIFMNVVAFECHCDDRVLQGVEPHEVFAGKWDDCEKVKASVSFKPHVELKQHQRLIRWSLIRF